MALNWCSTPFVSLFTGSPHYSNICNSKYSAELFPRWKQIKTGSRIAKRRTSPLWEDGDLGAWEAEVGLDYFVTEIGKHHRMWGQSVLMLKKCVLAVCVCVWAHQHSPRAGFNISHCGRATEQADAIIFPKLRFHHGHCGVFRSTSRKRKATRGRNGDKCVFLFSQLYDLERCSDTAILRTIPSRKGKVLICLMVLIITCNLLYFAASSHLIWDGVDFSKWCKCRCERENL